MIIYCLYCNNYHEADVPTACPFCGAVGDDLVENAEQEVTDLEPTEEEVEAMYQHYEEKRYMENQVAHTYVD